MKILQAFILVNSLSLRMWASVTIQTSRMLVEYQIICSSRYLALAAYLDGDISGQSKLYVLCMSGTDGTVRAPQIIDYHCTS